jgi:hypothetical protein
MRKHSVASVYVRPETCVDEIARALAMMSPALIEKRHCG